MEYGWWKGFLRLAGSTCSDSAPFCRLSCREYKIQPHRRHLKNNQVTGSEHSIFIWEIWWQRLVGNVGKRRADLVFEGKKMWRDTKQTKSPEDQRGHFWSKLYFLKSDGDVLDSIWTVLVERYTFWENKVSEEIRMCGRFV